MTKILAILIIITSFALGSVALSRSNPEYEFDPNAAPPIAAVGDNEEGPAKRAGLTESSTVAKPCKECEVHAASVLLNINRPLPGRSSTGAVRGDGTTK